MFSHCERAILATLVDIVMTEKPGNRVLALASTAQAAVKINTSPNSSYSIEINRAPEIRIRTRQITPARGEKKSGAKRFSRCFFVLKFYEWFEPFTKAEAESDFHRIVNKRRHSDRAFRTPFINIRTDGALQYNSSQTRVARYCSSEPHVSVRYTGEKRLVL